MNYVPHEKRTVYIGGFDEHVTHEVLHSVFLPFGNIVNVVIPSSANSDQEENPHRFGFVEFELSEDARSAIDNMHLSELYGKVIKCQLAKPIMMKQGEGILKGAIWTNEVWIQHYLNQLEEEEKEEITSIGEEKPTLISSHEHQDSLSSVLSDSSYLTIETNSKVFLDFSTLSESLGRLIILLRFDIVPKTCSKFQSLCVGEKGFSYKDSLVSSILKDQYIQIGKSLIEKDPSLYDQLAMESENFILKHSDAGMVSMMSDETHKNHSEFLITLNLCPYLNSQHVVFGHIISGIELLRKMGKMSSVSGKPSTLIHIENCGHAG
jgi:peptidyl-prolyl isomerase E (cyclophilin E)